LAEDSLVLFQALINALSSSLHGGMATQQLPIESEHTDCIDAEERPLFHDIGDLRRRAMMELRPIAEAWVNHDQQDERVHLIGNNAYGLRIYRRGSRLNMHVDKSSTHIVSAILHVDHDENSEPWPIVIEDYYGNLNEVILEKGDVLLYESSKCWHGRPRRFVGEWYTSLFIHFYPSDWGRTYDDLEVHYRIPPGWNHVLPKKEGLEALVMAETSAYEPDCVDTWCALNDTIKWDVRGEFGKHLSGDGVVRDLEFERKKIRVPVHWSDEL